MKRLMFLFLILASNVALANKSKINPQLRPVIRLELQEVSESDSSITKSAVIELWSNADAASHSRDDRFLIKLDNKVLTVPRSVHRQIQDLRYSIANMYPIYANNLLKTDKGPNCYANLRGGIVLYVEQDSAEKEMIAVYNQAACRFPYFVAPQLQNTREEAVRVTEILKTLLLLNGVELPHGTVIPSY